MKRRWIASLIFTFACANRTIVDYASIQGAASLSRTPKAAEAIEIIIKPDTPRRPFKVVALLKVEGGDMTPSRAIAGMRARSAAEGIDGVMDFECGDPSTYGADTCLGKGFVYTAQ
jgi:hypothetical protein